VRGPLALYVEYPDTLQRITASDSNFIFGSVGTGDATLIINGQFVDVNPNGSFLGWLPVPPRTREAAPGDTAAAAASDSASYLIVARRGEEVDTLRHWILLPPQLFEGVPDAPWIDPGSLEDRVEQWALPEETLEFVVRAAPDADVWLDAGSSQLQLQETQRRGVYRLAVPAGGFHAAACTRMRCPVSDTANALPIEWRAVKGGETFRFASTVHLRVLDPLNLPIAELREPPEPAGGADGIIHARPAPSGPYRWLLPNGTRAVVDGRQGDRIRLRFAPGLEAWVTEDDMRFLPAGTTPPTSDLGDIRFEVRDDRLTLRTWLAAAVPIEIHEPDAHTIELTLYGVTGVTNRIAEGAGGRLVERTEWQQMPGNRYRLRVRLAERVWGYRPAWATTAAGGAELQLEIRRPPAIDADDPLRGRRIAIDPGHPGAGAHGPTGYYEGDANLAIARILARLVREAGAEPVLIRDDTLPIGLYERTQAAIEAGAEVFVSIHNNALPDGVQPVGREGTSTYYYHPHSHDLAVGVHQGMLQTMRLRDLGVYWGDLAVTRMSWMPAILTEGAFMMIPSHEAALMNPEFQERYARGVLEGIEAFLGAAAAEAEAEAEAEGANAQAGSTRLRIRT
jgi:N-acetylmuramoyl-L-alanine amidase